MLDIGVNIDYFFDYFSRSFTLNPGSNQMIEEQGQYENEF